MKQLLILDNNFTPIATGSLTEINQSPEAVSIFVDDIQLKGYTPNHEVDELRAEIQRLKSFYDFQKRRGDNPKRSPIRSNL